MYLVLGLLAQHSGGKDDRQNDSATNLRIMMLRRIILWAMERLVPSGLDVAVLTDIGRAVPLDVAA